MTGVTRLPMQTLQSAAVSPVRQLAQVPALIIEDNG